MSCPYFREGYFGECASSTSMYVPSIDKMERHCFSDDYRLCLNISAYPFGQQILYGVSQEGAGEENRTLVG
jgi:hypothetical protein